MTAALARMASGEMGWRWKRSSRHTRVVLCVGAERSRNWAAESGLGLADGCAGGKDAPSPHRCQDRIRRIVIHRNSGEARRHGVQPTEESRRNRGRPTRRLIPLD